MNNRCSFGREALAIVLILAFLNIANAQVPIKVLLARGTGATITSTELIDAMERANDVMDETFELLPDGTYRFESAFEQAGAPQIINNVNCPSGVKGDLTAACAKLQLDSARNQHNADIVVLVVNDIKDDCGSVMPFAVNAVTISEFNAPVAFAVVDLECINGTASGREGFAHEVGHLLSLEHHDGDNHPSRPHALTLSGLESISYNHAEEAETGGLWHLTMMAGGGDCGLSGCQNGQWQPFFSENGRLFPVGLPAGNASESDSMRVIQDLSWDVVAAYRPLPIPPPECIIIWQPICDGNQFMAEFLITPQLSGYTVTDQIIEVETTLGGWQELFEGALSCIGVPVFTLSRYRATLWTSGGSLSQCEIYISPQTCGGGFP